MPGGTWIFTDIERLDDHELSAAAEAARLMGNGGARVLNDPARVKSRIALLRRLHDEGINAFTAYCAEDNPRPARFPVFVRAASDHRGPITPLLGSQAELDRALVGLVEAGRPLRGLMVIEYCAEEIASGVWRKLSAFRIGERVFTHLSVIDYAWQVKEGNETRLASDPSLAGWLAEEREFVTTNRFADTVGKAMALAGIEYGRADFGIVGGRPQIYEINTNPMLGLTARRPFPSREKAHRLAESQLLSALAGLDSESPSVRLESPALATRQHWRYRLVRSPFKP